MPGGSPACETAGGIVAEWQMPEFGTRTVRKTQVGSSPRTPSAPLYPTGRAVYFTYDPTTMTTPGPALRIAAENSTGTWAGCARPASCRPT